MGDSSWAKKKLEETLLRLLPPVPAPPTAEGTA